METIADRLKSAHQMLERAAQHANRAPNEVQLLAVSKTKPVSDIRLAYAAGQLQFGENYVQEGVEKIQELAELKDIEWHFIGPLQSNKSRLVAENFDWMQSLDRLKIAQRLSSQRPHYKGPLNLCIQVNVDDEASKSGVSPQEVMSLAQSINLLPGLKLRGLMAIPLATDDQHKLAHSFGVMHQLYHELQQQFEHIDTLSMGMSGDAAEAIAAGSTMVRLGTAIFGARQKKQQTEQQ